MALHFRLLIVDASHCDAVYDTRHKSVGTVFITLHPILRNKHFLSLLLFYIEHLLEREIENETQFFHVFNDTNNAEYM